MSQTLSLRDARRLALNAQGLLKSAPFGRGKRAVLRAIEHLGYIQIDPISVVCRAHHHTLMNRVPGYKSAQLHSLQASNEVFEYWSHAAAFIPIRDYRYCRVMMARLKEKNHHWYRRDKKLMKVVLEQIRANGPQMSRDFDDGGKATGMWAPKPIRRALHELFMLGDVMIVGREGIQKIYDLPERVIPHDLDTSMPDETEFADYLIRRAIDAHGFVTPSEVAYLRRGWNQVVKERFQALSKAGDIQEIDVEGQPYFTTPARLDEIPGRIDRRRVVLVSPFDNAVIQRKRLSRLFEFEYQMEIYLPADKRKYGYFSMPVLWGDKFVGRINPKAERKQSVLNIKDVMLEPPFAGKTELIEAFARGIRDFALFNQCPEVVFAKQGSLERKLERVLKTLA